MSLLSHDEMEMVLHQQQQTGVEMHDFNKTYNDDEFMSTVSFIIDVIMMIQASYNHCLWNAQVRYGTLKQSTVRYWDMQQSSLVTILHIG